MGLAIVILAAGEGTRMKSSLPKVLHTICGEPMISFVLKSAGKLNPEKTVVIVGHQAELVRNAIGDVQSVVQDRQLGTGHAVSVTEAMLSGFSGTVMVLSGDTPLIRAETLDNLFATHTKNGAAASIITARLENPTGYGRIIRSEDGSVIAAIVEEKDATDEQKGITEINTGTYCFDKEKLFEALKQVDNKNRQGEYYLTDVIEILENRGEKVVASMTDNPDEVMGVNNRVHLAEADRVMRRTINEMFMHNGVTIIDPKTTYISSDVEIGKDSVIYPMTFIGGKTKIGEGCVIGPFSRLENCTIGNSVMVDSSVMRESIAENGAEIGPFSHIRPGTLVKTGAKVGGFVEIKKSQVGIQSKVPHLSYIGDTFIGDYVNIGAGSITCNYDGAEKHQTVIEDGVFIGSDTMLVAPVKIGKDSFTGAGSVITKDVPAGSLAVERTEQMIINNWAKKKRKAKDTSKM